MFGTRPTLPAVNALQVGRGSEARAPESVRVLTAITADFAGRIRFQGGTAPATLQRRGE